jgi:hypothetical protein
VGGDAERAEVDVERTPADGPEPVAEVVRNDRTALHRRGRKQIHADVPAQPHPPEPSDEAIAAAQVEHLAARRGGEHPGEEPPEERLLELRAHEVWPRGRVGCR